MMNILNSIYDTLQHAPMFKRVILWKKHRGSIPSLGQGGHGAIGPARGQAAAIMRKGTFLKGTHQVLVLQI